MRVAFCGGGTGGHVYPALTVAASLRHLMADDDLQLLYIGVKGKIDAELVAREGIDFRAVSAGPLRTGNIKGTLRGAMLLLMGIVQSLSILGRFRPDVVFATGGYGSVGVGLAARLRKRPLLLFEPGPEAGLAVKLLSKAATRIAVTIPPALAQMPAAKTTMTGYPVRPGFFQAKRDDARRTLGLEPDRPVVLFSGASLGAHVLNQAAASMAPEYLKEGSLLHLCGRNDEAWLQSERARLPAELQSRWQLHAYLHDEMPLALAAADIAVMRSGASTLGELPATHLPAVLVPGEYEGWTQSANAAYLQSEGAAVLLPQGRLGELPALLNDLLDGSEKLGVMRNKMTSLSRPDAAETLARLVMTMGGVRREAVRA